jgi:hypothetical protein
MIEKVRSMAMILSLKRKRVVRSCGAYIGALAIRQASAGAAHRRFAAGWEPDSNMDYNDFTQMNPI